MHDLVNLLRRIDGSAQESVLLAIAALVRQNATVASRTQTITSERARSCLLELTAHVYLAATEGMHAVGIISCSLDSLKPNQQLAAAIWYGSS